MPIIPQYTPQVQRTDKTGGIAVDAASAAAPWAAVEKAGAVVERVGSQAMDYATQEQRAKDAVDALRIENGLRSDIDTFVGTLKDRTDYDNFDPETSLFINRTRERYMDEAKSPAVKQALEKTFLQAQLQTQTVVRAIKAQAISEVGKAELLNIRGATEKEWLIASAEEKPVIAKAYELKVRAAANRNVISMPEAEKEISHFHTGLDKAWVAEMVNADRPDLALNALNDPTQLTNLSPLEREQLKTHAKAADDGSRGIAVGTEIFKSDTTGSLEAMSDAVRSKGLDPKAEKAAIGQVKELYSERQHDKERKRKDTVEEISRELIPVAAANGGRLRRSDITPSMLMRFSMYAPEDGQKLIDAVEKDEEHRAALARADQRADIALGAQLRQEERIRQENAETSLFYSDDFKTKDIKAEGMRLRLRPEQVTRLQAAQDKLDPIKRDSTKLALSKINTGGDLAKALGGITDKNAIGAWQLKYSDLLKTWAVNHADDPNFDTKLNEYVDKTILSDLVTSWWSTDATDREAKFTAAQQEAGPARQRRPQVAAPVPALNDWLVAARKANPGTSDRELRDYYQTKYGAGQMRQQAIKILQDNNKPVTEANVAYIVNQLTGK